MTAADWVRRLARNRFLRFAEVGVAGFLLDWTCLTFFLWLGASFPLGRAGSYLCAATSTWAFNRLWTFASADRSLLRQWAKFLAANAVGGGINYSVSVVLALALPKLISTYPVLAVAAGSLAGLVVNFFLSRRFVFTG